MTLYELAGADPAIRFSPHCWKVRMALRHKSLEADGVPWRFTDKEAIAFSGKGTVPVLVDGATTVSDSWRIAQHLEQNYSSARPLFAGDGSVPLARFVNAWSDTALLPALARVILVDIFGCLHEKDRDYFRRTREKAFGGALETISADQAANMAVLKRVLAPLRQILREQDFVSYDAPTYADYCVFGMFMWARSCSPISLLEEDDPIYRWRERMLDAFDGYARAAPSPSGQA